jgi:hypothetical protein
MDAVRQDCELRLSSDVLRCRTRRAQGASRTRRQESARRQARTPPESKAKRTMAPSDRFRTSACPPSRTSGRRCSSAKRRRKTLTRRRWATQRKPSGLVTCARSAPRTRPLRKRTRGDEAAFQQGIKSGTEETSAEGKGVRIAAFRGESRRGVRRSANRASKPREPGRTNRKSKAREQPVRTASGRTALSHPGGRRFESG